MSDSISPSSSHGALLLMAGEDDPGVPSNLLMPCIQPDAPALFSDEEVEADSFVGQTITATLPTDSFKPRQFNLFGQSGGQDANDPFSQVQQPELLPKVQPTVSLNKPAELPSFGLPLTTHSQSSWTPAPVNVGAKSNPYAAGSAITSGRSGYFAPAETYYTGSPSTYPPQQTQHPSSYMQSAAPASINSVGLANSQATPSLHPSSSFQTLNLLGEQADVAIPPNFHQSQPGDWQSKSQQNFSTYLLHPFIHLWHQQWV